MAAACEVRPFELSVCSELALHFSGMHVVFRYNDFVLMYEISNQSSSAVISLTLRSRQNEALAVADCVTLISPDPRTEGSTDLRLVYRSRA